MSMGLVDTLWDILAFLGFFRRLKYVLQTLGGLILHGGQNVAVDVERHGDFGVPPSFLNDLGVDPGVISNVSLAIIANLSSDLVTTLGDFGYNPLMTTWPRNLKCKSTAGR
jgi:hypothetical protein